MADNPTPQGLDELRETLARNGLINLGDVEARILDQILTTHIETEKLKAQIEILEEVIDYGTYGGLYEVDYVTGDDITHIMKSLKEKLKEDK